MTRLFAAVLLAGALPALTIAATPSLAQKSYSSPVRTYSPPPYRAPVYSPPPYRAPVTVTPQRSYTPPPQVRLTAPRPVTQPVQRASQPWATRVTIRPAPSASTARRPEVSVPKTAGRPVLNTPAQLRRQGLLPVQQTRKASPYGYGVRTQRAYRGYNWIAPQYAPYWWYGSFANNQAYSYSSYDDYIRRCLDTPPRQRSRECVKALREARLVQ